MSDSDISTDKERRKFYRITDAIGLEYKLIDHLPESDEEADVPFSVSGRFRLLNELTRIDQEGSILLRHISDEDRNLARYLGSQNKKIETIAKLIVSEEISRVPYTVRTVSLSEGGCSFITEEQLDTDQNLALKLFFFSSYLGMILFGHVVESHSIGDEDSGLFQTNVEFSELSGPDRQMLARYIIRRQAEKKRADTEED
ncbi:MAG: PilZ domain-containing protein [Pseudomonadales bacterium]|nr:PilZ domain-containing protein [Pseudomonadales bacterium]